MDALRDATPHGRDRASSHHVQFYQGEAFLTEQVASFLGAGLGAGAQAIVIATPEHHAGFAGRLSESGIDVTRAAADGRYVALDARETLERFLVDGMPDATLFEAVVGALVRPMAARGPLRAFGEMVALLRADGNTRAALRLERLWNELAARCPFALLCAYPMQGFAATNAADALLDVCREHDGVVPSEGYALLPSAEARERFIVQLQQKAAALDREVAEREWAEDSAREHGEMLRSLVHASPVPIVVIAADTTVRLWNPAAEQVFGWYRDEILGRPLPMVPVDKREECASVRAAAVRGQTVRGVESARRRKDGSMVEVLISAAPLLDRDGVVREIVLLFEDVTDRNRLHAAERRARAQAEAANRAKDEFLAMLGHELRNPLSALRTAVATARLEPRWRERALDIAARQAEHLGHLVDDLLDVARITHGKITLARKPVRLAAIVEAAVETMRPLIAERGHALSVASPPSDVGVDGDPTRLEQVLVNLISNAAKYTEPGGHVQVVAERVGAEAVIRVRDDGQGLGPELLPRVFDLFLQGTRDLDRGQGGLGVGLTLVRKLVELHAGRVEARSDGVGRGSEFTITLPAISFPTETRDDAEPAADGLAHASRVLVVDDNVDAADSLKMLLEVLGHRVQVAYDGHAALAAAAVQRPDVMVVDIGLPGLDGYEVARAVRQDPSLQGVVLVALTGYGREEDRDHALHAGFDFHLLKPVNVDDLRSLVGGLGAAAQPVAATRH